MKDDLAKKFGAKSFIETPDDETDEEEHNILSFELLKNAFAKIGTLEEELGLDEGNENDEIAEEDEQDNEPEYDDLAGEEEIDLSSLHDEVTDTEKRPLSPRSVVEAMLFVGNQENRPLAAPQIAEKMRNVSPEEVDAEIAALNRHYEQTNRPYFIQQTGSGYQMVLHPAFEPVRNRFYGKERLVRLSQKAIETLALVAYKQPITADEISSLLKEPCNPILNQLAKRGLVCVEKKTQEKKVISCYRTTERFLTLFELGTLAELPMLEDV